MKWIRFMYLPLVTNASATNRRAGSPPATIALLRALATACFTNTAERLGLAHSCAIASSTVARRIWWWWGGGGTPGIEEKE